ncbi:MAG: substrate-binding domain-containing protein [Erysipelotrichaceae bacterium]|nr:substrate-binding domain-containing protein [Erysipelotrichaceae bacterium]
MRIAIFAIHFLAIVFLILILKIRPNVCKALIALLCIGLMTTASVYRYQHNDEKKYQGHGFDYMHGFSSTDFEGYYVYSEPSKLVTLDHPASLLIEDEKDMPVLDGAEACYPLYCAVAKAIYKDIDRIEKDFINDNSGDKKAYQNGKIVTFTNTVYGYWRLADRECDMLFGARPSQSQTEYAKSVGVEYQLTAIGREGFIFFVEEDNPVDNLTSEQVRAIYHGDITNWSQVGGKNQEIVAFQRPEGSGSQTMMLYFMGDVSLKEPKTYETFDAMSGVIEHVAQYNNEAGAMGYTFRYFLEGLNQEKHVKILSIDGVAPTVENIKTGAYPLITTLYCVTRANENNENVQKVLDFLLSEDGQYIIEKTGYAPLNK